MTLKNILFLTLACFALTGCETDEISLKTVKDPQAGYDSTSPIVVDSQTDVAIEKRKYFMDVPGMVADLGLNVVGEAEAEYVLFFKFKPGLKYDAGRDDLKWKFVEQDLFFGVIDAGLFKLSEDKKSYVRKSEWIGFVEVKDIREPEEIRRSLELLLQHFTEDAALDVRQLVERPAQS